MLALTPTERRGALVIVVVLLIGAGFDQWRLHGARPAPPASVNIPGAGIGPTAAPDPGSYPVAVPTPVGPSPGLVDLNRATLADLDRLPGIGPVLASRIVAHRDRHGPFRDPAELIAVPGIGPALAARLAPWVTVAAAAPR